MKSHCFDHILFEILTLLPAKSLMRFTCVSKAWNALIQHDLNFAKSHIARSQATRLLFELKVLPDIKKDVAVKENNKRQLEGFPLELLATRHYFCDKEMCTCSNHCNGLVCLYSFKNTQVYLLNVTTREIKALSFSMNDVKSPLYPPRLCLGFDLVTEKYKLLQVFEENNIKNNRVTTKMRIRTLGTDSCWRNCCCMPSSSIYRIRCNFLNGVLYWAQSSQGYMFYFNLREEELWSFSLPEEYSHFVVLRGIQTALWGKLVMHCYNTEFKHIHCIYDEINNVFTKFNYPTSYWKENKMFASLEVEKIVKSEQVQVLATSSIINDAPAYLVFPTRFLLADVSSFIDNIIPLSFLV